jgi:hypothetical protein
MRTEQSQDRERSHIGFIVIPPASVEETDQRQLRTVAELSKIRLKVSDQMRRTCRQADSGQMKGGDTVTDAPPVAGRPTNAASAPAPAKVSMSNPEPPLA